MKYQTNYALGLFLNTWGCFHNSILQKVEKHSPGFKFSNSDVFAIYLTAMRHGLVQQEVFDAFGKPKDGCDILDKKGLYNTATEMFGLKTKCIEYRREGPEYELKPGEEEILELARKGYGGVHFVSGNGKMTGSLYSRVEFDPIEGGSQCVNKGYVMSKRILVIKDY